MSPPPPQVYARYHHPVRRLTLLTLLAACHPGAPPSAPVAVAVAVAVTGSSAPPSTPPLLLRIDPPAGPGAAAAYPQVAARVFAVGDSQLHHVYGKRTFAQSPFADR